MLSDKVWTTFGLGRRRENLRFDVLFLKFYKTRALLFRNFKKYLRFKMQQQMQRERVNNNERNSLGENSAESVSPVSSGAPATSRDLLNALAEQKLPTLLKQETPKTPRRSKCPTPVTYKSNNLRFLYRLFSNHVLRFYHFLTAYLKSVPRWLSLSSSLFRLTLAGKVAN